MKGLEDLYQEHGNAGFLPISVVVQDGVGLTPHVSDAELWADGLGLTYPVLADVDGEFFGVWDPAAILPVAFIIDADGVVAWSEAGGSAGLQEMEAEVLALLGGVVRR